MKTFFICTIGLYRRYISPFFPPTCRFTPTCSEYAIEAFRRKSTLRALWMTLVRIAKCHPFHPGGYDPVDPVEKQAPHGREHTVVPLSSVCEGRSKP